MTVEPQSHAFKKNATQALDDRSLQSAMSQSGGGLALRRTMARAELPEFEALRDAARDIKNHALEHLDVYLERFESQVTAAGGHVHWAETAEEAAQIVVRIARETVAAAGEGDRAPIVNKGKSMVAEEIGLNAALEAEGGKVLETDLGEYIIQLRGEAPSHIIAPAVHVTVDEVEADFRRAHDSLPKDRTFPDAASLVREARLVLRDQYFGADVGVTGANMLIAETGQTVIVTNEGNGDLTQSLAKAHVVIASLEKIVPTLEDAATILRVLGRSATGQSMSSYTTFSSGPRRENDPDGPEEFHVVLLDNGRSKMIGGDFQDMLRCIRCGACMNHCPVYRAVGGHAYGWVYPGPMGAVLTPLFVGVEEAGSLPNASTFCGRCESVCPMKIPLPKLMRQLRAEEFDKKLPPAAARYGLGFWGYLARRPVLYRRAMGLAVWGLRVLSLGKGRIKRLPLGRAWTRHRDFPAPQGPTFMAQWAKKQASDRKGTGS